MGRMFSIVVAVWAALAATLSYQAPAFAWGSLTDREARLCDDHRILNKIQDKFRYQVKHVPNLPQVSITDFNRIQERRYIPYDDEHPIARRYCAASVLLSDGQKRAIFYLIEDRMWVAGVGDNVEFCVSGFDRWFVYNGQCRVLR
jgi:capsid protein